MTQKSTVTAFDYQTEAQRTKSTKFYGSQVGFAVFRRRLDAAIMALQALDEVKKQLFYGKFSPGLTEHGIMTNCLGLDLPAVHADDKKAIDLLHGIIGKATEAGEMLEALFSAVIEHKPMDRTNIIEEVGDGHWYDAIILEAVSGNFADTQRINIAKLRARFPEKFSETKAIIRDIPHERTVLEDRNNTQTETK